MTKHRTPSKSATLDLDEQQRAAARDAFDVWKRVIFDNSLFVGHRFTGCARKAIGEIATHYAGSSPAALSEIESMIKKGENVADIMKVIAGSHNDR